MIRNTVKTAILWNIIAISNVYFQFECILKCNLFLRSKAEFSASLLQSSQCFPCHYIRGVPSKNGIWKKIKWDLVKIIVQLLYWLLSLKETHEHHDSFKCLCRCPSGPSLHAKTSYWLAFLLAKKGCSLDSFLPFIECKAVKETGVILRTLFQWNLSGSRDMLCRVLNQFWPFPASRKNI